MVAEKFLLGHEIWDRGGILSLWEMGGSLLGQEARIIFSFYKLFNESANTIGNVTFLF